nr:unnamed protein product [Digitaria exilis]
MRCVSGAAAVVRGAGGDGEAGGPRWGAGPGRSFHLLWLWVGIGGGEGDAMSRCFPFPPPGYEARPRRDQQRKDGDLLKKEKHKEKKYRKEKDRAKGEIVEKDRDRRKDKRNKKHKREKRRERGKNEDRDKDKKQSWAQQTQKNDDPGNIIREERGQNEAAKDIKPTVDLDNHKCDNNRSFFPRSADSIGAAVSKEKERNSLGRTIKKSAETTQDNHGIVRRRDSTVHDNRKGAGRGVDSKTNIKNKKSLQVGSAPDFEISIHSAKGKNVRIDTKGGMMGKENQSANNWLAKMNQLSVQDQDGQIEGKCKAVKEKDRGKDNLMELGFYNENKYTSDDRKKRKDFDTTNSQHELNMKTTKLPRVFPTKDEQICRHSQQTAPYSSTKLLCPNACETDRNNTVTGSRCSEENIASVSSSGCKNNKGYLKRPHSDTKYLSQLYSIPSVQDFSDYIDQGWLFSQDRDGRKPAALEAAESDQVWSDARLIDIADVIALPYVVPL